jgi:hydroxymethylglutaryl-CoA lyase
MENGVKIVECPRDAWQGLSGVIPAEIKARYLRMLIEAGFTHIDAVSFVSPAAVPQMADSEQVLTLLQPSPDVEIIGIVVNAKGAERAIATGAVRTLGFPYSTSPEFLKRNQRQTREESLEVLKAIRALARGAGLNIVGYISMAFGNPYGDPWSSSAVVDACGVLIEEGVNEISLADTVGLATPAQIAETVDVTLAAYRGAEIGVHLHTRHDTAAERVRAAYDAGCRRFDAAIGGLGGCPFAQDTLMGNLPTEVLVETLRERGAEIPTLRGMESLIGASAEIEQDCAVAAEESGSK